jgi:hypothetical protein
MVEYWGPADDHLMREVTIAQSVSAPVNFIVHTLKDVNKQLELGRPFFVDILKQGIALYEAEDHPFVAPQNLPPQQAPRRGSRAISMSGFESASRDLPETPVMPNWLSQETPSRAPHFCSTKLRSSFYHCTLLVLTLYSPKSHKLNFLRGHAEEVAPSLIAAWPRDDRFSRRCFELLRQAYVNARYSPLLQDQRRRTGLARRAGRDPARPGSHPLRSTARADRLTTAGHCLCIAASRS